MLHKYKMLPLVAVMLVMSLVFSAQAAPVVPDFVPLVQSAGKAVVNISTEKKVMQRGGMPSEMFRGRPPEFERFFEQFEGNSRNAKPRTQRSLGTGFLISSDGYIVTNNHVVAGADTDLVNLQGSTGKEHSLKAQVIGTDQETDIALLKEKLSSIDRQMATQRKNRGKTVRVALVGYTNVGKSTLMNLLSKSEVFAENKLFATLDTTVRKVIVDNLPFLLSDTVGFIRKLPTHLVDSFKSTLDEVREADLLLHIVDISHPAFEEQIEVVNKTLQEVCDSTDKPMILVFNKIDAFSYVEKAADDLTPKTRENITLDEWKETWMGKMHDNCIFISAKEKKNIDELKTLLYQRVKEIHTTRFPYNDFLFQHYDEITTDEES